MTTSFCNLSFTAGQVDFKEHTGSLCLLMADANPKVRSAAVDTIVDIYFYDVAKLHAILDTNKVTKAIVKKVNEKLEATGASTMKMVKLL